MAVHFNTDQTFIYVGTFVKSISLAILYDIHPEIFTTNFSITLLWKQILSWASIFLFIFIMLKRKNVWELTQINNANYSGHDFKNSR
jgi:hypothetical protein